MKVALSSLILFLSQMSFADVDLSRCSGRYLVSAPSGLASELDLYFSDLQVSSEIKITNRIIGVSKVIYALESTSVQGLDIVESLSKENGILVECNPQLSF